MKPEITIQKTISDRSRLATQLMFIGITVIGAFLLSGCQETSMVHNASFQNLPLPEKKVYTLAAFPSHFGYPVDKQNEGISLIGSQCYVERLMSIYEDSHIPTLTASTSGRKDQGINCLPILIIVY